MADSYDIESLLYRPGKGLGAMAAGDYDGGDDADEGSEVGGDGDEDDPRDMIKRKVTEPKRGPDGLCLQPDYKSMTPEERAEREVYENHQRLAMVNEQNYADPWTPNSRTFDPLGRYNCGRCNKDEDGKCLPVTQSDLKTQLVVNEEAGSCRVWENTCAGDPESRRRYLTIARAGYAIAANGEGWGCSRCPYKEVAGMPDSRGRGVYCKVGDCRVLLNTCCDANGLKELPIDADGNPSRSAR